MAELYDGAEVVVTEEGAKQLSPSYLARFSKVRKTVDGVKYLYLYPLRIK